MASPQCTALADAMKKKGLTYNQLATEIGSNEQRVQDICMGKVQASANEFNSLARALNISAPPGHCTAHST